MSMEEQGQPKNAKADKAADKARHKAMRPWFKKKRFIFPLAIVAISIAASASGGGGSGDLASTIEESSASKSTEIEPASTSVPGIGDEVSDGKFTFVVNSVECGIPSVGSSDFGQKAQGQFCDVDLVVANTGTESQTIDTSSFYLFDSAERKFSANTVAMFYLPDNDLWLTSINPGNSINGHILFDLPVGATPTSIELHDSMFSGGVTVQLSSP